MSEREQMEERMEEGTKGGGKARKRPTNRQVVNLALQEMKNAVPKIERRVMERDALAAESRFEAPRTADITTREDDD